MVHDKTYQVSYLLNSEKWLLDASPNPVRFANRRHPAEPVSYTPLLGLYGLDETEGARI